MPVYLRVKQRTGKQQMLAKIGWNSHNNERSRWPEEGPQNSAATYLVCPAPDCFLEYMGHRFPEIKENQLSRVYPLLLKYRKNISSSVDFWTLSCSSIVFDDIYC